MQIIQLPPGNISIQERECICPEGKELYHGMEIDALSEACRLLDFPRDSSTSVRPFAHVIFPSQAGRFTLQPSKEGPLLLLLLLYCPVVP